MPLRRVKKRRTSRKKKTGERYFRRPSVVVSGPVPPSIRRKLKHSYFVTCGTKVAPYVTHYIFLNWLCRPAQTSSNAGNCPQDNALVSLLTFNGQYPFWYPFYYNTYNQYIQLGLKYKVTFLFESFPSTINTLCGVGTFGAGSQNTAVADWPWSSYRSFWDADTTKFKFLRGINSNSGDGLYITMSGHVDAQQLHGEPIYDDRFRQLAAPPGSLNATPADIGNTGGCTSGLGTLALFCTSQTGASVSRTWPTIFVELVHDVYFFDRRTYPLQWVPS